MLKEASFDLACFLIISFFSQPYSSNEDEDTSCNLQAVNSMIHHQISCELHSGALLSPNIAAVDNSS